MSVNIAVAGKCSAQRDKIAFISIYWLKSLFSKRPKIIFTRMAAHLSAEKLRKVLLHQLIYSGMIIPAGDNKHRSYHLAEK